MRQICKLSVLHLLLLIRLILWSLKVVDLLVFGSFRFRKDELPLHRLSWWVIGGNSVSCWVCYLLWADHSIARIIISVVIQSVLHVSRILINFNLSFSLNTCIPKTKDISQLEFIIRLRSDPSWCQMILSCIDRSPLPALSLYGILVLKIKAHRLWKVPSARLASVLKAWIKIRLRGLLFYLNSNQSSQCYQSKIDS